jgi:F0F1-type ATP synthase epsilon subunit
MTSLFSFPHNSLKVTPLEDDQVQVTVTLHSDDFIYYIRQLDSLTGFVRVVKNKTRVASNKALYESEESINERKQHKERYYSRIVESFDSYTSQGLDRTSSIKPPGTFSNYQAV